MKMYGALEAGGTKMVLALVDENGTIYERQSIPTQTPNETIPVMIDFFQQRDIEALGIGCFGPLDLNPMSPTFGYITATPKLSWRNYPIRQTFMDALHVPVALDTDVNAAALAEARLGAAEGLDSCVYVTIGTGIGGGVVIDGKTVHGLMHPELGHQLISPVKDDPTPDGFCPYHQHCLEGLAAGPSIQKRWKSPAQTLLQEHPAWKLEAEYLAQMCHNILMTLSPEKLILGGGVMGQPFLLKMVQERTLALLGGYMAIMDEDRIRDVIVAPKLAPESGVLGAWLLGKDAEE